MSPDTKYVSTKGQLDEKSPGEGSIRAVFSTFDMVDDDGDVLLAEAFTPGQKVPMVYGHKWDSLPIGRGEIDVEPTRAIYDGKFFTDTTHGRDAYLTVKEMGDLQEYSWGFRILAAEPGTLGGQPVQFIKDAEVYEVSPVLVGANRNTYTLAIKSQSLVDQAAYFGKEYRAFADHLAALLASLSATDGLTNTKRQQLEELLETFSSTDAVRQEAERVLSAKQTEPPTAPAPPSSPSDDLALIRDRLFSLDRYYGPVPH